MNLSTDYLGLKLKNPLMPGACPLAANLDTARKLEDAGAAAIVMHSLFEEQIGGKPEAPGGGAAPGVALDDASDYVPDPDEFQFSPDEYFGHIARLKAALEIPVIASLNGVTQGGWTGHARGIEQAGADALELNFYEIPDNATDSSVDIEVRAIEMLQAVKENIKIPVAVKLSPFFTSLPNFASELQDSGAAGLVLFNHFFQADIDIERMDLIPALHLPDASGLLLRLRWLAIVSSVVDASLAASGGVYDATGALKAIMAGADVVQLVSVLLKRGPAFLKTILNELENWLEKHG
jgi:dihydroorotate dehydrogenase (fumarate)